MISDATFAGGLQIPHSGDPILLMADRQTTGGYPQIATVITVDLPVAGQLAPGDWVEFELCTRQEAIAALIARRTGCVASASPVMLPSTSVPLAPFCTLGIGGAARWLARATSSDDVAAADAWAASRAVPLFVLGGGSNVVIADEALTDLCCTSR
jgi:hypothetical protein